MGDKRQRACFVPENTTQAAFGELIASVNLGFHGRLAGLLQPRRLVEFDLPTVLSRFQAFEVQGDTKAIYCHGFNRGVFLPIL
jgi:hypothetical protein